MVHSRLLPIVVLACSAFTATASVAQTRFALDPSGQKVIGISGLPTTKGCFAAKGSGTVVERQVERGDLAGFFIDMGGGERSFINVPDDYEFRNRATHAKAQAAFAELLRVGNRVSIGFVACGAAGRIMRLTSLSAVAAPPAQSATPAPPPSATTPPVAASPPAAPPPADSLPEDGARWLASIDDGNARTGIADGNHFTAVMLDCRVRSGSVTLIVDDPRGRYRRGTRQSFRIVAGQASVALAGKAIYNDMDEVLQIEATVPLAQLQGVLSEIARQSSFVVTTPGGSQPLDIKGAAQAIPGFTAACGAPG